MRFGSCEARSRTSPCLKVSFPEGSCLFGRGGAMLLISRALAILCPFAVVNAIAFPIECLVLHLFRLLFLAPPARAPKKPLCFLVSFLPFILPCFRMRFAFFFVTMSFNLSGPRYGIRWVYAEHASATPITLVAIVSRMPFVTAIRALEFMPGT